MQPGIDQALQDYRNLGVATSFGDWQKNVNAIARSFQPGGGLPPMVIFQQMNSGMNVFTLLAVPFFIYAGDLMVRGGIAAKIVALAGSLVGHLRGGVQARFSRRQAGPGARPVQRRAGPRRPCPQR